ncbi:MAG: hypothetical protein AB7G75_32900, partial [Candidatus Binatia bacterium]
HTRPNHGTFAGTYLSTRIDVVDKGDGIAASWSTAEVTGTLGKRTVQAVTEPKFTGVTAACPGGVFIIDAQNGIGFGTSTATFPNGDQIYSRILTRTQCGLGAGKFEIDDVQEVVSGTGKFEGALGTAELHSISFCQASDSKATPPQCFGSFTGEFTGTITLP